MARNGGGLAAGESAPMDLPLIGHVDGDVVARSPEPHRIYYSNPDWLLDDRGPLLLWDTFGEEFRISLARQQDGKWTKFIDLEGAMHSHIVHLPEQGLDLILGVDQHSYPRNIELWWSTDSQTWTGPFELFGGADYHAGSTPWAVYEGRLHVPFEVQGTKQWGSHQYGSVHAAVNDDLRWPGNWYLSQSRVPWTVLPGCSHCGALEGNLIVAPDGQLYNFLRIPAYNRLGRAVWRGDRWVWLGLVQGVHNQSKHEIFPSRDGSRWYLLANGWPARGASGLPHALRNTLCLWEATEPDLSRWRMIRVIASDHHPDHAFSYVCGLVDGDDTLWIGERHGDDETHNFHDTNCVVVRSKREFTNWSEEPAVVPFGHDQIEADRTWVKTDSQDGLLLSHLDGASYPMRLTARFRIEAIPATVGVLDLLGFATCDLVLIAGLQLVNEGHGAYLGLSTGGRRVALGDALEVGQELRLEVTLLSPLRVEVQIDDERPVMARTHVASDPSLAGILPRADRPGQELGRVRVIELPRLVCGGEAHPAPELPSPLILADGRGITGALAGRVPTPMANLAEGGPLLASGHCDAFEPWAGGLMSGAGAAAIWSPLTDIPTTFTCGGFGRLMTESGKGAVILSAIGQRTPAADLDREQPYLAMVVLQRGGTSRLAVAWASADDRQVNVSSQPVTAWFSYAVVVQAADERLAVTAYGGECGGVFEELFRTTVPLAALAGARHWLALAGQSDYVVRGYGGVWVSREALTIEQLQPLAQAGFATKLDTWPHRVPTCAVAEAAAEDESAEPDQPATN